MNKAIIYTMILTLTLLSCSTEMAVDDSMYSYLHISHTREFDNKSIDSLAAEVDYSNWDVLMLGGDLMNLSSESDESLSYLDHIFDLSKESTLWSLGNHDYTDVALLETYTEKNRYYSYHTNGVTFLVLDSQLDSSIIREDQLSFTENILDTISASSHLILLTHHLIWLDDDGPLAVVGDSISNAPLDDCWYCVRPNNFYDDIYPQLVEIEESGTEVVCIAGDIGNKVASFEYETEEGVTFLASGIFYPREEKKALIFDHSPASESLAWRFVDLQSLTR